MPVVGNVAHDQGVVEGGAAGREGGGIVEEGGFDGFDGEVPDLPVVGFEADAIEAAAVAGDGEADAAGFEEGGGFLERAEAGGGGEVRGFAGGEADAHRLVARPDREVDAAVAVGDVEVREVVLAGEDPAAGEMVRQRAGVAARDEDTFLFAAVGSVQRTAMRCAAFSLVMPLQAGQPRGRMPSRRIRQMPAMAWPSWSFGRKREGRMLSTAAGSTR